ncbi:MAG: efflux RND transporter periplasmic adaptor subunit [Candidatus Hydrogenedentes bacterium]|nr:efflux RND transporter periplasmic adaptor subunit [Candidatus Hydrogenedentota bacterium]
MKRVMVDLSCLRPFQALSVLGVVLAAFVVVGCSGNTESSTAAAKTETSENKVAIPVEVSAPTRGDMAQYFDTTSRVEAEKRVQVTSEGVGKCLSVNVEEGDKVSAGDVLAELDKAELSAQMRSAKAQLQKLKSDYDRSKQLVSEGLSAPVEFDNARYAYEQQLASVNQLQVQLDDTTIRSPINGIITKKLVQRGQLVSSGSPAFEVVDPNSYMLTIQPPEKDVGRIKVGQVARVEVDAAGDQEFEAKVRRINPSVEAETGTVKVTLDFDSATMAKLRDAAFARVQLVLETRPNVLRVPKDAVVEENARKYLFIVEKKAEDASAAAAAQGEPVLLANRVEIETGLEDKDLIEVVSGVKDDSMIVTLGQQTLKSGSEVKVTTMDGELMAKAGLSADEALKEAEAERKTEKEKKDAGAE